MSKPDFVYQIYIRATAEKVWAGLLEPEFTRQYWWHENVGDWEEEGSRWEHRRTDEEGTVDITGEVIESDPPHKLVLTWARPGDRDNPARTSRVTFEIEPQDWPGGPWVGVRLTHDEFGDDDEMRESVSYGWPGVLSGLKTLIETGWVVEQPADDA